MVIGGLVVASLPAGAVGVIVGSSDTPGCDVLSVPTNVDELGDPTVGAGTPPFPPGEQITHSVVNTIELTVCTNMTSNPLMVDAQITITNLQAFAFYQVWFVMDTGGTFSNADGLVNGTDAMLIDTAGFNQPLLFESGVANGIFDAGETWVFHVQDYVPFTGTLNADDFFSPGQVGAANTDRFTSIIAIIPEPSVLSLALFGGLAFFRRCR